MGLQVLTQPFRTLTKLYRARSPGAGAAGVTAGVGGAVHAGSRRKTGQAAADEAEMQKRGECDEIRNSMAELKPSTKVPASWSSRRRCRCQRAGLCAVRGQRAPSRSRVVDCRAVGYFEAPEEKPR